jgi:hypothetical protein
MTSVRTISSSECEWRVFEGISSAVFTVSFVEISQLLSYKCCQQVCSTNTLRFVELAMFYSLCLHIVI